MTIKHSENSSYREKLVEHLFVGELLKLSWQNGDCALEIASPEVDNSGYDIIVELNGVVRHIQLKASYVGGKTARQKVHRKLASKPSGCVVWVYFNESTLELGPFLFFGGAPGTPLPSLDAMKIAKHMKGDQDGFKAERPNIRELNKGHFVSYSSVKEIYGVLFGNAV
jgi:hypothetical protein